MEKIDVEEIATKSIHLHSKYKGKISYKISSEKYINLNNLIYIYTPGVASICKLIAKNKNDLYKFTNKSNTFAIISNGTAVLGLGDTGAESVIPVLESKAALLNLFTKINCVPISIKSDDVDFISNLILSISLNYRGIILEDIKSPTCFKILNNLQNKLEIPIFHDDQHATAVAILIALLRFLDKKIIQLNDKILICGLGAAGIACANLLNSYGFTNIYGYDKLGAYNFKTYQNSHIYIEKLSFLKEIESKSVSDVIKDAKIFIGLSVGNIVTKTDIEKMKNNSIIMALANPWPEISSENVDFKKCYFYATGNNREKNTINNIFVYPTICMLITDEKVKVINDKILIKVSNWIYKYCKMNNFVIPIFNKIYFNWIKNNISNF